MIYKITYTKRFEKHFDKMTLAEKRLIKAKVEMLSKNPLHPSLRTKRVRGTDDLFECSVNMNIRIIWYYESGEIILLLDVGHHNILDRL